MSTPMKSNTVRMLRTALAVCVLIVASMTGVAAASSEPQTSDVLCLYRARENVYVRESPNGQVVYTLLANHLINGPVPCAAENGWYTVLCDSCPRGYGFVYAEKMQFLGSK